MDKPGRTGTVSQAEKRRRQARRKGTAMNDILSIENVSGVWRVEIRLPNGERAVVSEPGSFQAAMAKASLAEIDAEPA